MKLLLDRGALVDAADNQKDTALHVVVFRGYVDTVKLLIGHGANPALRNAHGEIPRDILAPGDGHPTLDNKRRTALLALLSAKNPVNPD